MLAQASNEKQELRIKEILDKGLETSVFNDVVFSNYNNLIKSVVYNYIAKCDVYYNTDIFKG